jgi:agmatine deiminase
MPAEWSEHATCYISWPCKESTWHGRFERSKAAYADVIRAVSGFEPVTVLATPSTIDEARRTMGEAFDFLEIELNDSWIRDNGPIFVRDTDGKVAIVKFGFNAWGNKFPPYDKDDLAPVVMARRLGMRHILAPMVLEGGAISVDGEGTLLTTEQCLLNPNRNPSLSRAQMERILADYLGIKKVVWLWRGVEEDLTDGHVDGVATFAAPHLVVASRSKDESDPNFDRLEENLARIESATDAKGRSIEIVEIVQPKAREVDGLPITPGYTNHYIANGGVIVPIYGIREDGVALETLKGAYPGREVVGVRCEYIEIGGGAVHCITQQRPAGDPMPP